MTSYNGFNILKEFITLTETPTLMKFVKLNQANFRNWHTKEESLTLIKFLSLWKERFISCYEEVHTRTISAKYITLSERLVNIAKLICDEINSDSLSKYIESSEGTFILNEPLMVGELNVSSLLLNYKSISLTLYNDNDELDDNQKLSLDNVFNVNCVGENSPFLRYTKDVLFNRDGFYKGPSTRIFKLVRKINKFKMTGRIEKARKILNSLMLKKKYGYYPKVLNSLLDLEGDDIETSDKSLFTELVKAFCRPIFKSSLLKISGCNTKLIGHAHYKPDIKYHLRSLSLDILAIEIKTPANKKSDFYKLIMELRHMVTMMALKGINNPTAFGLLVAGLNVSCYQMKLIAPGIYFFALLGKTGLPREVELFSCLATLPFFLQVSKLVKEQAELFIAAPRVPSQIDWTTIVRDWEFI